MSWNKSVYSSNIAKVSSNISTQSILTSVVPSIVLFSAFYYVIRYLVALEILTNRDIKSKRRKGRDFCPSEMPPYNK